MKRKFILLVLLMLTAVVLSGCCIRHDWQEATCQAPKTCTKCGKTQDSALPHVWQEATCETGRTCAVCGIVRGEPLGHKWDQASCETPRTCSVCGLAVGSRAHVWAETELQPEGCVESCISCEEKQVIQVTDWESLAAEWIQGQWKVAGMYDKSKEETFGFMEEAVALSSLTFDVAAGTAHYVMVDDDFTGEYRFVGLTGDEETGELWLEFEAVWGEIPYKVLLRTGDLEVTAPGRYISITMGPLVLYWVQS